MNTRIKGKTMAEWGKLIGTVKSSGIQVFERFEGPKRILTSIKNSKVLKTIEQSV